MKILRAIILLVLLSSVSFAAEFRLDAEQFTGGEWVDGNGAPAVLFSASAGREARISARFDRPVPPGSYLLELERFGPPGPFSPNVVYEFNSASRLRMRGFFLPVSGGRSRYRAGVVLASPASRVTLSLDRLRGIRSLGLVSLRLTATPLTELKELPLFLECAVESGKLRLPGKLPYGLYQFTLPCPAAVRWNDAFTTPFAQTVRIAASPASGLLVDEHISGFASAERYLPRNPLPEFDAPVMKTFDLGKRESGLLKLQGEGRPELVTFPGGRPIALATSWDDGRKFDHRLTDILLEHGIRGTLAMNRNSEVIGELKTLMAKGFEIGSHSWHHPFLHLLPPEYCRAEAEAMRAFLETETRKPVISFVYPFYYAPSYDEQGDLVIRSLREAGYWMARTTRHAPNTIDSDAEPLAWNPDFHFLTAPERVMQRLAEARQAPPGSALYIWGHSYELENGGEAKLLRLLEIVARQTDIWYATQGELAVWRFLRRELTITPVAPGEYRVSLPWIHPALRTVPIELELPSGCTQASWNGRPLGIENGRITLDFPGENE